MLLLQVQCTRRFSVMLLSVANFIKHICINHEVFIVTKTCIGTLHCDLDVSGNVILKYM